MTVDTHLADAAVGNRALEDEGLNSLIVLEWNVYMGNRPRRVRRTLLRWLKKRKPDVVVLNEAMKFHDVIRQAAEKRGYWMIAEDPEPRNQNPRPEHGNTVMLVRKNAGLALHHTRFVPMDEDWMVWSHKQKHDPRIQVLAILRGRGGRWVIVGDHWATAGNREAQQESMLWMDDILRRGDDRNNVVAACVGDKNVHASDILRELGHHETLIVKGHSVDLAAVTGASHVIREVLPKKGSDHHAVEYEIIR